MRHRILDKKFGCDSIASAVSGLTNGFTRVIRLGRRIGDGAETDYLEWVGITAPDKRKKPKVAEEEKKAQPFSVLIGPAYGSRRLFTAEQAFSEGGHDAAVQVSGDGCQRAPRRKGF